MATYLKYLIFFERLCTEYKTMTESTRPRGCHFIIQKANILATTGMKATLNFTLKKRENKHAALTIWGTNPPLTWGPGKLNTAIDLIYIVQLLVISNEREWFYKKSLKSIVTKWNPKLRAAALLFPTLNLQTDLIFWVYKQNSEMWPSNWKLLSSTFLLCCSFAVQGGSNFCVC